LWIKSIIDLDTQITNVTKKEKDSKKKMNAANAKGLNGMKQKVKKQLREFETAVEKYKTVSNAVALVFVIILWQAADFQSLDAVNAGPRGFRGCL
jgi:hypothetical protein